MNSLKKNIKYLFLLLIFIGLFGFTLILDSLRKESLKNPKVEAVEDSVIVKASLYSCILKMNVKPESRTPSTNNWQTEVIGKIYSGNNFIGEFETSTNNLGNATVNLCDQNIFLNPGTYNFFIKGKSHLNKEFANISGFTTAEMNVDFSDEENYLIAGETSKVYDNYINVLDLSTQINKYNQADDKNDLNQDGVVNILDISISILNIYKKGDCAPNEQSEICV